MYLVYGRKRIIKKVKEILDEKGERYDETKILEYLLVWNDPKHILPPELQIRLMIKNCDSNNYFGIIKGAGELKDLFTPFVPEAGGLVRIKSGAYRGLFAVVKEVKNRTCVVEFNILGRIVADHIGLDDVEDAKSLFNN